MALRAFESAARHLSFTVAADELCVTQSAISRHVKNLEEHYRLKLFNRLTRALELTEAGARLFAVVEKSFDQIETVSNALSKTKAARSLVVSILPTLASNWLMPRLVKFTQMHQNVEVRLVTSIEPVAFDRDKVDVAIRVGNPPSGRKRKGTPRIDLVMTDEWRGVVAERLFADILIPVCRPDILKRAAPIAPADLLALPLIHTDSRPHAWEDWFHALGVSYPAAKRAYHFGHFFMSLGAAISGRGVALVPDLLAREELASGRLVTPVPEHAPSGGDYYLLYKKERAGDRAISAFRQWLLSECSAARG
jgi:LysR family transcriptional regulator, glycine cleavage system transcriptional activator